MKYFDWNEDKNAHLKEERGIQFEEVVKAVVEGNLLKTIDHPNQKNYPNQKIMIVEINQYAYVVPFVEDDEKLFLKTIFPSRKYTRQILEKKHE